MICKQCGRPLGPMDIFCGECGTFVDRRDTVAAPRIVPPAVTAPPTEPIRVPASAELISLADDQTILRAPAENQVISEALEVTRIVRPGHKSRPQVELSFSTGGEVQVSGTGLLGRNPKPNLDEQFDQLVLFRDPSRTVSKTHCAFRVESDGFWIQDRGSVNGSYLLNEMHEDIQQFPSGEWFAIANGSLIGIGDEHFSVRYLSANS